MGLVKQASEAEVVAAPSVADDLRSVLLTKSASTIQEEASDLGRQLARRIMEKAASETLVVSEVVAGDNLSALAASVESTLIKEASEVSAQPNVANSDNAALAAAQEQVNHTAEQSGGTVEAQTIETIQKGLATPSATATSEDLVRKVEDQSEDNMQKAAAVSELVAQGHSFDDAADLVAMADSELQKEAAFKELTAEGYSFDDATSLIKAASETFAEPAEITKEAAMADLLSQGVAFGDAVNMIKEAGVSSKLAGLSKKQIGGAVAGGAAVVGGAVGAKKSMTKEAALQELMDSGYTFTQALNAVQA
jgi:SOS response regulatory protein OraA/RecX